MGIVRWLWLGDPDELCRLITAMIATRDAPRAAYNEVIAKDNTTSNASEVFPDSIVVECRSGERWSALRLIFQKTGTEWFLVYLTINGSSEPAL
jgi:hypothetical protein